MMTTPFIWLVKLLLAHLLTDFILQPASWVRSRKAGHFTSPHLYLHGLVTGAVAWWFMGWGYWLVATIILITHIAIDGWKSYRPDGARYFLIDQALHLLVIAGCWLASFFEADALATTWSRIDHNGHAWLILVSAVFLTVPAGILIGQLTRGWRDKIDHPETLANAGKWIGMIERIIVLILVMLGQFSAISLLIAAKGIIRFNEKDRPEVKTEYLVIGTLMSIGIAIVTGVILKTLLNQY